jgi:hypothetical protein
VKFLIFNIQNGDDIAGVADDKALLGLPLVVLRPMPAFDFVLPMAADHVVAQLDLWRNPAGGFSLALEPDAGAEADDLEEGEPAFAMVGDENAGVGFLQAQVERTKQDAVAEQAFHLHLTIIHAMTFASADGLSFMAFLSF